MVFGYLQVGSTIPRQEVSYSVRTSFFWIKEVKNETRLQEPKQTFQEFKQASQTEDQVPVMTWSRLDRGAKCFMITKKYRSKWDMVIGRVTCGIDTGDTIENHNVEWNSSKQYKKFLHKPLPKGVTDIETVLYHRNPNAIQEMPT